MTDGKMIIIFLTFLRASRELKAPARRKPDVFATEFKTWFEKLTFFAI